MENPTRHPEQIKTVESWKDYLALTRKFEESGFTFDRNCLLEEAAALKESLMRDHLEVTLTSAFSAAYPHYEQPRHLNDQPRYEGDLIVDAVSVWTRKITTKKK